MKWNIAFNTQIAFGIDWRASMSCWPVERSKHREKYIMNQLTWNMSCQQIKFIARSIRCSTSTSWRQSPSNHMKYSI